MKERSSIVTCLQHRLPKLMGIYAFGSRIQGNASAESDLDLAVLVAGYADPHQLWELAGDLSDLAGCPVDLLDFRAASTVMQSRILTTGERWWAADSRTDAYEASVLNDKLALDAARAPLLDDIQREGHVYGR